jgi:DNA-binding MarR family transcriptional regulator
LSVRAGTSRRGRLPIDSSLFFKLVRVVNLTARPFVETLSREHELSLNEWRVMVVLASHPGVAATEVADHTGLDKMSVSRAIAALARHDRLDKDVDGADARRTLLRLSTTGSALYRRIGALAAQREAELFGGVSATELAATAAVMDKLIASLAGSEAEQAGALRERA